MFLAEKSNQKIQLAARKHEVNLEDISREASDKKLELIESDLDRKIEALKSGFKTEEDIIEVANNKFIQIELEKQKQIINNTKLSDEEREKLLKESTKRLELIVVAGSIDSLNSQIDNAEEYIEFLKANNQDIGEEEKKLSELKKKLAEQEAQFKIKSSDKSTEKEISNLEKLQGVYNDFSQPILDIISGLEERKIQQINSEGQAEQDKFDRVLENEKLSESEREQIEARKAKSQEATDKKIAKIKKKQATREKAAALIQIAISTAVAAVKSLETTPLPAGAIPLALTIAAGVAQAAAVAAQPIPEFAEGTSYAPKGLAWVGDGGQSEIIKDSQGNLSVTPDTPTLTKLKGGEEIFPSFDDFFKNSNDDMIRSLMYANVNKQQENKINEELISKGITKAINKGFKEASVNTTVINKSNSEYTQINLNRY